MTQSDFGKAWGNLKKTGRKNCRMLQNAKAYKKNLTIKDLPKCLPFKNTQDLLDFNNVSEDNFLIFKALRIAVKILRDFKIML
ncbi:uncharacterized protein LOC116418113 isoform X2 [Nasonia vitripennis]|nr:uncharacterized protein LOC116418113 isoform X2 [Nasonia vitripennis]